MFEIIVIPFPFWLFCVYYPSTSSVYYLASFSSYRVLCCSHLYNWNILHRYSGPNFLFRISPPYRNISELRTNFFWCCLSLVAGLQSRFREYITSKFLVLEDSPCHTHLLKGCRVIAVLSTTLVVVRFSASDLQKILGAEAKHACLLFSLMNSYSSPFLKALPNTSDSKSLCHLS